MYNFNLHSPYFANCHLTCSIASILFISTAYRRIDLDVSHDDDRISIRIPYLHAPCLAASWNSTSSNFRLKVSPCPTKPRCTVSRLFCAPAAHRQHKSKEARYRQESYSGHSDGGDEKDQGVCNALNSNHFVLYPFFLPFLRASRCPIRHEVMLMLVVEPKRPAKVAPRLHRETARTVQSK